jgi:hypothetical protein
MRTLGGHGISELPPHLNAASSERTQLVSVLSPIDAKRFLEEGRLGK